jgi:hypothetical protein
MHYFVAQIELKTLKLHAISGRKIRLEKPSKPLKNNKNPAKDQADGACSRD